MKDLLYFFRKSNILWENNDFYNYNMGCFIEVKNVMKSESTYEILGFNIKGKLEFQKSYNDSGISALSEYILESYMIIIRTSNGNNLKILHILGKICRVNNCFAPIILLEDGDTVFFPKLRYQDGILIKSIMDRYFERKQYCVVFGSEQSISLI